MQQTDLPLAELLPDIHVRVVLAQESEYRGQARAGLGEGPARERGVLDSGAEEIRMPADQPLDLVGLSDVFWSRGR